MKEVSTPKERAKKFGRVLYDSAYWTIMHDGVEHAGYMAFLGLLSFFPFLVLFVALSGLIDPGVLSAELVKQFQELVPEHIVKVLAPRIDEITSGPPQDVLTVAIIGVLWTASSIVEGTRTILNRVYHVHTPPAYILRRLLSLVQMLIFTGVLTAVMLMLVVGPLVWGGVKMLLHLPPEFFQAQWNYLRYGVSGGMIFIVVAMSYYTLPNIKQLWLRVVPGTLAVMIGWFAAAEVFSLYLQHFNQINLVYGSLAGIIAALVFMYVISVIYIFGAEFNYFLDKAYGFKFEEREKLPQKKPGSSALAEASAKVPAKKKRANPSQKPKTPAKD